MMPKASTARTLFIERMKRENGGIYQTVARLQCRQALNLVTGIDR
jgi:hypothetical protein